MKKTFTILIAAIAAILMMTQSEKVMGQTYTYVLATSLSAGDEVVIVNTGLTKELTSVSSNLGNPSDITGGTVSGINGTYILTVEAGSETDSWAFKNGSNYLAYTWTKDSGNNYLTTVTIKQKNSSWTVSFNASNQATIANCNKTNRKLQFNNDRFCCYTSTQTAIKIYKRVEAKVATPTFSPAAGSYTSTQSVTISSATTGATIYYTTDGSTPTTSSSEYSSAISVSSNMTIKALAVKDGLTNSDVAEAAYSIVQAQNLTITSAHGDVTVTVNSSPVTPTAGVYSIPQGATVNLSVTPSSGYIHDGWTVNSGGVTISNNAFVMPDGDVSITANYIATTTYTFDFTSTGNFYTTASGNEHPSTGSSNNYDEFYSASNRDKFTASGTNHYFNSGYFLFGQSGATVGLPSFEGYKIIKVVLHSSNSCSQSVGVSIVNGSGTTVASAQTWSVRNNDYIYTIPSEHQKSPLKVKVTNSNNAQFTSISIVCVELPSFELTIGTTSHGTFTVKDKNDNAISDGDDVKEGALVKLAAAPEEGYVLEAFSVTKAGSGSVEVTTNGNNGTFNMPDDAVTVHATFAAKKTLKYKANGGTGDDVDEDYASGTNVELKDGNTLFTAPTAQHYFLYWTKNADGTGTQYSAGSEYELTENTTLYANWSNLYNVAVSSVENVVISASYGVRSTIAEGGNANVAYGTTITLNHDLGADKTFVWDVYKTDESSTKVTVENNLFTVPAYGVTVSGEIKDVYTITFDVNGNTAVVDPVNVIEGNSIDLTDNTYKPSLAGYTFKGWSETNGSATTIATPATYTPTASKTLYAVFTKVTGSDNFTLTKDSGFPDKYNSSGETLTLAGHSFYVKDVGTSYNDNIQIKNNSGVIYNSSSFGKITEIKLEGTYTNTVIYYGNSSNPSSETISPGTGANAGKYDLSEIKPEYIKITSSGGASNLTSIKITYEDSSDVIFVNSACTKASIAAGEIVNVGANGILTLTEANAGTAANLIIEDGGQLITTTDASVKATVKKNITTWDDGTKDVAGWHAISSPVDGFNFTTGGNFVPATGNYTLYAYDEANCMWINSQDENDHFNTLAKGQGYLYRKTNNTTVEIAGTLVTDGFDYSLSFEGKGQTKGFNLIGNPYTHNIYKGEGTAVPNTYLKNGFYYLTSAGGFTLGTDNDDPIAPGQAVLVQATAANNLAFTNTSSDGSAKANHDKITFKVANSQYEDVTCAMFDKGEGINKINHRNVDIPMIYIPQNGKNYALAMFSDFTEAFDLSFKANTTGVYTLSYTTKGEFNYLHVIDRLTGADVDMLLDGEYKFIGTPKDNDNRFIVRLAYMPDYSGGDNDIFAFQSGSDIYVSGQGELQIFDVTGRYVMSERINGATSISADALSKGVYVLRIVGSEIKTQKIVVR